MVNLEKGVLVECDPQMKQFLIHLDETLPADSKFILKDLDATHLFISADKVNNLRTQIDDLMEKINFVEP